MIADAGFGKSTLLASWSTGRSTAWYTVTDVDREIGSLATGLVDAIGLRVPSVPTSVRGLMAAGRGPDAEADEPIRAGAHAALIADALEQHLARDLVLVIDELAEIGEEDPAARFLEILTHMAPARLHIVLAARRPPPFAVERLRGQGQVLGIDGGMLAFRPAETAELLCELLGADGATLAGDVQEITDGWPAAVRLAAEALRVVPREERPSVIGRLLQPGGAVYAYLATEAVARSEPRVRSMLEAVAPLNRFSVELCEALGIHEAGHMIPELASRGLFVQSIGDAGWYQLTPMLREFMAGESADVKGDRAKLSRAATWHLRFGEPRDAVSCLVGAGDSSRLRKLLERSGGAMLAAGDVDAVLRSIDALPVNGRSQVIDELEGEARQVRGDWDGALRCFARVAPTDGPMPARLAWRTGLILHLRGELDAALETYARGRTDGADPVNEALLHAWWASALWLRGEVENCRGMAALALDGATTAQDDRALAASHTVMAMLAAMDSDRRANDAHYLRALEHAQRANDVLQTIRIHVNRGSHFGEEGYYAEALAQLDEAIRLADLSGFAAWRALALSNRGQVLLYLGRLDEAMAELQASRALYQRLESRFVCYPLIYLGELYLERGDLALARAHFEEAIGVTEAGGDQQGLIPALSGLARVLVHSEPQRAADLAVRAVDAGPVLGRTIALLAAGHVALMRGFRSDARLLATQAESLARERRDRAGLAQGIELSVRAAAEPAAERDRLEEALMLWRDIDNPIGEARAELALAELLPAAEARPLAEGAQRRLQHLGARRLAADAGHLLEQLAHHAPTAVEISSLGGFQVLLDGQPVPLAKWRSRKARDVLKLLVAARGRRIAREQLLEALWPDDSPDQSSPRLSVALSTIRAVLDPHKKHSASHYLAADRSSVRLQLENLSVDVEGFFESADRGLTLYAAGRPEAPAVLAQAEAAYRGDFLAEDPYEDWAIATREAARGLYQRVAGSLARIASAAEAYGEAADYLWRMLERDPWDEEAHLQLVSVLAAGGRPGEARRAYRRYAARMRELDLETAPFPEPAPTVERGATRAP